MSRAQSAGLNLPFSCSAGDSSRVIFDCNAHFIGCRCLACTTGRRSQAAIASAARLPPRRCVRFPPVHSCSACRQRCAQCVRHAMAQPTAHCLPSPSPRTMRCRRAQMSSARPLTVRDVNAHDFIRAYAQHLKRTGKLELPSWVDIVKTANFKELAPYDSDWYYIRAAAIARQVYLREGTGIGGLRKHFGGRNNIGVKRERFEKATSGVIRHILHNLEKMNIVEHMSGGRWVTCAGWGHVLATAVGLRLECVCVHRGRGKGRQGSFVRSAAGAHVACV